MLAQVREISQTKLASRAAIIDREAIHPKESWRDLWEAGFLATGIPKAYGGLELGPLTYLTVVEEIAKVCANTAMTVHMHSMVTRMIAAIGTETQKAKYFSEVVKNGKLFGSWGSEPGVSITSGGFRTTLTKQDADSYVVHGQKYFCTMAGAASYAMIWCTFAGAPPNTPAMTWIVIPTDSPGLQIHGTWDPLGMRGTISPSARIAACSVTQEQILGKIGDMGVYQLGVLELFMMGWAAICAGIAEGALEYACNPSPENGGTAKPMLNLQEPIKQASIGEAVVALDSARAFLYQAATAWETADPGVRRLWGTEAKASCSQAALLTTNRLLELIGGRAALKEFPLERAFRDVRTATLMPPPLATMFETVGKSLQVKPGVQSIRL